MPSPHVSVLLPAFNAAITLPACLRSIQRQTKADWECIVVDDGSTDDTAAVARRYARRDPRFVVIETAHAGLVAALNTGLERCRGAWVARMDADDIMHRDRLRAQAATLERSDCVAVGCHVRLFPRYRVAAGRREYECWLNSIDSPQRVREESFVECPIAHPALAIRTSVLVSYGYRDRGWPEDYDLILRLLAAGREIGVVPRRLLCWRDHGRRLSRLHPAYAVERFTACKAAFLAQGLLSDTNEYVLWGYGETGRALRQALLAHGKHPAYIVEVHSGRLANVIHGAPVIAWQSLKDIRKLPLIASVAGVAPRQQIRTVLRSMGYIEMVDFVCAA